MRFPGLRQASVRPCVWRCSGRALSSSAVAARGDASPPPRIAQPLPATHPHLMAEGEVTPGISAGEYSRRRQRLAEAMPAGSMALFPASARAYMSHDVPFPHHQDSDLLYLCGLHEPSSLLACVKPWSGSGEARWHVFVRPECANEAMWDGPRAGLLGAQSYFLPEGQSHALSDAAAVLSSELHSSADVRALFYSPKANAEVDALLAPMLRAAAPERRLAQQPPAPLVQPLRVVKSDAEVEWTRRSAALCIGADERHAHVHAIPDPGGADAPLG